MFLEVADTTLMGQFCAVLVWMQAIGSAPDDKSFHAATNGRNECTMASFKKEIPIDTAKQDPAQTIATRTE
jgi:hypothetical protein